MIKIMMRKKYDENQSTWDRLLKSKDKQLEQMKKDHEKEKTLMVKDLNRLLDKALKIEIQEDGISNHNRFRLMLEIDERWIKDVFLHGNDHKFIHYFGQHIAQRAEHEIFRINTVRN